jgi:hypothetical protein
MVSVIDIFPNPQKCDITAKHDQRDGTMKYEEIGNLMDKQFLRLTGVKSPVFENVLSVLHTAHTLKKARGFRSNMVSVENALMMALEYLREYRTCFHIGKNYCVSERYAYKLIRWTEDTLIQSGGFSLPGNKEPLKNDAEYDVILVDTIETPVARPKMGRKAGILGKKWHTIKTQVVVDQNNRRIICTAFANGKRHDFRLFKKPMVYVKPETEIDTGIGYQGITKLHTNSVLPKKKTKKNLLTKESKTFNRAVSSRLVVNEHIIGCVKH